MPQRYRAIFDSAVDFAIIAADRDGRVADWNRGAERVLGWSAEEMHERQWTASSRLRIEPVTLSRGRADDERWHLRKDGSRFWAVVEMTREDDGYDRGL